MNALASLVRAIHGKPAKDHAPVSTNNIRKLLHKCPVKHDDVNSLESLCDEGKKGFQEGTYLKLLDVATKREIGSWRKSKSQPAGRAR